MNAAGKVTRRIPLSSSPDIIASVPVPPHLQGACARGGQSVVIDARTQQVVQTISTAPHDHALGVDPYRNKVYVGEQNSTFQPGSVSGPGGHPGEKSLEKTGATQTGPPNPGNTDRHMRTVPF